MVIYISVTFYMAVVAGYENPGSRYRVNPVVAIFGFCHSIRGILNRPQFRVSNARAGNEVRDPKAS